MHGEVPQFKRCCFCLPLRGGLIGWGYFRLGVDVLAIIYFANIIIRSSSSLYYSEIAIIIAVAGCYFIDAVFAMFLVVGGHKKSPKSLRISYIYSIVWLALVLTLGAFLIYNEISYLRRREMIDFYTLKYITIDMGVFIFITFAQVYVILLTRTEEIKLRKENLRVQFVNNAADAESICMRTSN